MLRSKSLLAIALSVALLPLNSIAMDHDEGQPPRAAQQQRRVGPLAPAAANQPAPAIQAGNPVPVQSSWSRFGRQLIKPLAFIMGAAALGGVSYLGNKGLTKIERADWAIFSAVMGGLTSMSYTRTTLDNEYQPPVARKGSFFASLGFAATAAALGIAAAKISDGVYAGTFLAYIAGLAVGNNIYNTN